jgi:hypothetical protein
MRILLSVALLCPLTLAALAADEDKGKDDTLLAAKTRKLLKTKISVEFKDTRLDDVKSELMDEVKGLKILLDTKGGVSRNQTITYKAKNKSVEQILDEMLKKPDLGYIVISKKGDAYDGLVQIRKSKERGYEEKKK